MIGTIGSLVQETSSRFRWLLATGIYTVACIAAALLLGALLGFTGQGARAIAGSLGLHLPLAHASLWIVGALALAYAASDLGWLRLPRPRLRDAVPITWWRHWRP